MFFYCTATPPGGQPVILANTSQTFGQHNLTWRDMRDVETVRIVRTGAIAPLVKGESLIEVGFDTWRVLSSPYAAAQFIFGHSLEVPIGASIFMQMGDDASGNATMTFNLAACPNVQIYRVLGRSVFCRYTLSLYA